MDYEKWCDSSEGQTLGSYPTFAVIGKHHEMVHTYAREIVSLVEKGDKEKAEALMAGFENDQVKLFEALHELYLS